MNKPGTIGMYAAALLALWSCGSKTFGVVILCAGDSITEEAYPRFLQQALKKEGRRARVLNYGKSGYTTGEYLKFLRGRIAKVKAETPNLVLLQLGTNDVRVDGDRTGLPDFERNLREIVVIYRGCRSRGGGPAAVLLATIPPIPENTPYPFSPESARRVVEEINPAIRALAAELALPLVDNYALFAGEPGLLPGVHPSPEGYRRLALNWRQALRPFLD
jgi:lysophospholipase L1-like esterase